MITNQTMTKLKQARLGAPVRMTQKEVAARAGMKLRTYQDYEQGNRKIYRASVSTVNAICTALGCTYQQIDDKPVDKAVD